MLISVFMQKGEQAKTNTAINVMSVLSQRDGYERHVLVDLDHLQEDATKFRLSMPRVEFVKERSEPHKTDLIVVDAPPYVDDSIMDALAASDFVILPVTPNPFSLDALRRTFETLRKVKAARPKLLAGVVFTRTSSKPYDQGMMDATRALSEWPVLDTWIPERIADFRRSTSVCCPLVAHRPKSAASQAYVTLVEEILHHAVPK